MRCGIRAVRVMAGMCTALLLTACLSPRGGASAQRPQQYDLGPPAAVATGSPAGQWPPLVLFMDAAPILADTGMLWRVGQSASPQSYAQARWAATPVQLVRQRLIDHLSGQRPILTDSVVADVAQLRVTLIRFEQVFTDDGTQSQGHVGLAAMLVQDRRVMAATRIDTQAPAPTQDAQGGVQALRAASDEAARQLSQWANVHAVSGQVSPARSAAPGNAPVRSAPARDAQMRNASMRDDAMRGASTQSTPTRNVPLRDVPETSR